MTLKWIIKDEILLNENAIAWISFSGQGEEPRATVRFLVPHPQTGQLVSEVFSGAAVEGLRGLGNRTFATTAESETADSTANLFNPEPLRKKKGWFFSRAGNRPAILAFVNSKGSSSVRSYDVQTGIFLGKSYRSGDYQDSFSDLLSGAVELTVDSQPNLERDCKERLPDRILAYLKNQAREPERQPNR